MVGEVGSAYMSLCLEVLLGSLTSFLWAAESLNLQRDIRQHSFASLLGVDERLEAARRMWPKCNTLDELLWLVQPVLDAMRLED